jgi:formamidopyrimidine-DNA glycosylase
MSGQLLVQPASAPLQTHTRVRLRLDTGVELRFVDQRTFGGLAVFALLESSADGTLVPQPVAHIGVDPLEATFDPAAFTARLRRRRTGVKRALLDQTLASGIGNIYADEALWRSRLHYARPTETLRRAEVTRLVADVQTVMREALQQGGTSFDSLYVNVNGQSGYFDLSLAVYGQRGRPCPRCGTPVRRDAFMNRSSFTCPRCQPRPRRAHW